MKKSTAAFFLTNAALSAVLLAGSVSSGEAASAKKDVYTLKMTYTISGEDSVAKCAQQMAARIKEKSNGRLVLENYPNGELATDTDALELAAQGSNVITFGTPDFLAAYVPDLGILDGPFLFKDYTEFQIIEHSDWLAGVRKTLEQKGIRNLGMNWYFGARHLIQNTGKPIAEPADLKGVRIRSASSPTRVFMIEALGGTVTQMNWSEVYSALNQGICQGCEAPLSTLYNSKIYETCKDISLTGHIHAIWSVNMSAKVFNSLPEDLQQLLVEEIQATAPETCQAALDAEKNYRALLEKEGVRFTNVDYAAFKAATEPVYSRISGWTPGLYDTVRKAFSN